jgi:hypothetical protein
MTALAWRSLFCVTTVGLFLLTESNAGGQAFVNGSISGNVTDNTGAAVPAVTLTLTNLDTSAKLRAQTDSAGAYEFLNLPPGRYGLEAEKTGFQRLTRQPLIIEVNSGLRIDLTLPVGTVSETVTVTAETPLLQPETSALGQVVESRAVNELPLNGRNPMALVALVPGVVPQGQFGQSMVTLNPFAAGNVQINGGQANQSAAYWDGAPLNAIGYGNLQALIPSQDALQEFKVMTNNLSAEYDRFAGGIVNFTSKTGTNQYHGEAYEYLRNKVLNANNFFNNSAGLPVPAFTQNQFGGNLAGPIVIPHLYNGKDKTFFFVGYDGFRLRQGLPLLFTVPTVAERSGDFSNFRDASGNVIPIYDPATTRIDPTSGQYVRDQISCNGKLNVICPAKIDPTASVLTSLWGLPNRPGAQYTSVNNWAGNASQGGDTNQFTIRGDQNISDKQRIFGRYTRSLWDNLAIDPFHTNAYPLQIGTPENYTIQQGVIGDSYSFSPTIIGDFALSYLREAYTRTPGSLGYDLSKLGPAWALLNNQVTFRTLPVLAVSGITDFSSQETGSVIVDHSDDWTFRPNLSIIRGSHTIKFGADLWVSRYNYAQTNVPSGDFNFNQNFTASGPFSGVGGSGFASFMLGDAASGSALEVNEVATQVIYRAFYAEDNIRVNRKLTLNLGLRYDQEGPFSERFNRISTFLPAAESPLASPTGLPVNGAFALVNTPQRPGRNGYNMNLLQFAPRFGFGYQLTPKTVIRGGYGLFWLPPLSAGSENPSGDPVNSFSTPMVSSIDGGITPYSRLSNPFPNGIVQPPGRDPNFQSLLLGEGVSTFLANNPFTGYVQQWNLDVQQELPGGVFLDLAYAGSRGVHLPFIGQLNQLNPQYMPMRQALFNQVKNPFYGLIPSISALDTPTVPAEQLLLPFSQYNGVSITQNEFDSRYNSMQLKVQKRFGDGQQVLVSYTVSKLITNTDSLTGWLEAGGTTEWAIQNNYNLKAEESVATFDTPQRMVASYVLELPIGQGKKYLSGASGLTGKIVSGWGVEGITTLQKGFPLFLGTSQNLTGAFNAGSRPNFDLAACPHGANLSGSAESRLNEWFNTTCFVQPPAFTFGNVSRTLPNTRTDGLSNFDFSVFKNTTFGPESRMGIQFRAEIFNLFNTPQFGYPGMTVGTPQFGVISSQINQPRLVQFGMKFVF